MKLFDFKRVLVLSPHPDDAEYGVGGTVLKHTGTQFLVRTLSCGSAGDPTSRIERAREASEFWDGVRHVDTAYESQPFSGDTEEWLRILEPQVIRSQAVLAPPRSDSHQEHRFTNRLAHALVRSRPIAVLSYATPSTLHEWAPNLFVEIDLAEKQRRLRVFESQQHRPYFDERCIVAFHADMMSSKKGYGPVERLRIEEVYG